jgi:hypothetical protein
LFAGDDLALVLEEENEDAEGLLAHLDGGAAAAQFLPARVYFEDPEAPGVRLSRHNLLLFADHRGRWHDFGSSADGML